MGRVVSWVISLISLMLMFYLIFGYDMTNVEKILMLLSALNGLYTVAKVDAITQS